MSTRRGPLVSVVMPCHNARDTVIETIAAIQAQTLSDWELVAVDDGSTDATFQRIAALDEPRIRLVHQPNRGPSAARNLGVLLSRAPLIALQDADDLSLPQRLEGQRQALLDHPEWAGVGSGYSWIGADGQDIPWQHPWQGWPAIDELETWLFGCPFFPSATMLRRRSYLAVGGMEPDLRGGEDWNLWLKIVLAGGGLGWHRQVVCRYRVSGASLSNQARSMARDCPIALGRILADPCFPPDLQASGQRALALRHLDGWKRFFQAGLWSEGCHELDEALDRDPSLAKGQPSRLEDEIIVAALSPVSSDPRATLGAFVAHLPPEQRATLSSEHLRWRLRIEAPALARSTEPLGRLRGALQLPKRLLDPSSRAYLRRALENRLPATLRGSHS